MTHPSRLGSPQVSPRVLRTRTRAIAAARRILLEEGWAALTQQRVAKVAGLGRATVYRHWPDRIDLLHDLCAAEIADVRTVPTGNLQHDLWAELEAIRREVVENGFDKVLVALIDRCFWEPDLRAVKQGAVAQGTANLRAILVGAVREERLRSNLDVEEAISSLVGPILYRHLVAGHPVTREALGRAVADFLTVYGGSAGHS